MSRLGGGLLLFMALACLLSVPYTFGRAPGGRTGAAPRRYEAANPELGLLPPSWSRHTSDERRRVEAWRAGSGRDARPVLGTGRLGRDLLVRCLAGGGISLGIGLCAALLAVAIGTSYGTVAALGGGRIDALMMRVVDVLYGLPTVLLVVLLAVAVDGAMDRVDARAAAGADGTAPAWIGAIQGHRQLVNVLTLLLAIAGVSWLTVARVIRGQVLSLKQQPFMEACRAIGVPWPRQIARHLLPNLLGPMIVYATLTAPQAILSESFLSFLGIGVREPLPSWGNLAAAGLAELNIVRSRWWLLLWPCLFIALTLLALNFVGEGLREKLDPRENARAVE
jgi:oligopeptide transport system permease protein